MSLQSPGKLRQLGLWAAFLSTLTSVGAQAAAPGGKSAGCAASNVNYVMDYEYGSFEGVSPPIPISSFAVGETITMTFTRNNTWNPSEAVFLDDVAVYSPPDYSNPVIGGARKLFGLTGAGQNQVIAAGAPGPRILTHTITEADLELGISLAFTASYSNLTVTCSAGGSTPRTSNVRAIQLAGTSVSSQVAAASLAGGVSNNVASRLPLCPAGSGEAASGACRAPGAAPNAGVGSPSFLGARRERGESRGGREGREGRDDGSAKDDAATVGVAREQRRWSAWGDLRQTGFDRDDASTLKQVSAMGGIDLLLHPNLLLGAMGGYEHSDFKADYLQGSLKGNGSTFGLYGGYRFTPSIRGDLAVTWTWLDYDIADNSAATPVTANFGAIRKMISGGLTGSYMMQGVVVEPSARLLSFWQNEAGYADSAGENHAKRDFSAGRASLGSKFSLPYASHGGLFVSPYAGIYGDLRYGTDTAMTDTASVLGLQNGWSARTTAGLSLSLDPNSHSLTVGGELGGLGSDATMWTWGARGAIKF